MNFIKHFNLLSYYKTASLFILSITFMQASKQPSDEEYLTLNFWFKKGSNGTKEYVEKSEQQQLANNIANQNQKQLEKYVKKSYQVGKSNIWSGSFEKIAKDLNLQLSTTLINLDLLHISTYYDDNDNELVIKGKLNQIDKFSGAPEQSNFNVDKDIIVGKKAKNKENIKFTVKRGNDVLLQKELSIYSDTQVVDLILYAAYDSNKTKEMQDKLVQEILDTYLISYNDSNKGVAFNNQMMQKKVQKLNGGSEITFYRPLFTHRFYCNKDSSLLLPNQFDTPEKIKSGIAGEWQCISRNVLKGYFLWPFVDKLLTGISALDIELKEITKEEDGKYKDDNLCYIIPYKGNDKVRIFFTVDELKADENKDLLLINPQNKNLLQVKCILKKEGDETIIREENIYISYSTRFITPYLHLLNRAGYLEQNKPFYYSNITYTMKSNLKEVINLSSDNFDQYSRMKEHMEKKQQVVAYTYIIPSNAKLSNIEADNSNQSSTLHPDQNESEKTKSDVVGTDSSPLTNVDTENKLKQNESKTEDHHSNLPSSVNQSNTGQPKQLEEKNKSQTPKLLPDSNSKDQYSNSKDQWSEIGKYTLISLVVIVVIGIAGYLISFKSKNKLAKESK